MALLDDSRPKSLHSNTRIGIAIILGNTLAWADFALYAYFAPVLSHVFFPFTTNARAYVLYFIIFALAFFFRPIGSAIAGVFADRNGRKNTLLGSVIIISTVTALIGCIPSYNQIGFLSPFLLAIGRILQTMAVSAEPTNSGSLLIEHASPGRKGFVTSCVVIGIFLGFFMGIFSFLIISYFLTPAQVTAWGWRIPFIGSLVIGVVVVWFLAGTAESPLFLQKKAQNLLSKTPLRDTLRTQKKAVFMTFGYSLMMAVSNYFLLGYIPTLLSQEGLSLKLSNLFITISLFFTVILIPWMGMLSDKIGRRPVLAAGAIGYVIFSYPMLWMMSTGKLSMIILALIIYGIILAPVGAVLATAIAEMFPIAVRCTASTLGYNAALVLFGGTTPIIAELLVKYTHDNYSPFWFLGIIAFIHLLFILFSKETKNSDISL
jgi:MHS family proline/betaine transporter-like MFS transporter